jgi:hypothetical protein
MQPGFASASRAGRFLSGCNGCLQGGLLMALFYAYALEPMLPGKA